MQKIPLWTLLTTGFFVHKQIITLVRLKQKSCLGRHNTSFFVHIVNVRNFLLVALNDGTEHSCWNFHILIAVKRNVAALAEINESTL